jgi:hypothetical protein
MRYSSNILTLCSKERCDCSVPELEIVPLAPARDQLGCSQYVDHIFYTKPLAVRGWFLSTVTARYFILGRE